MDEEIKQPEPTELEKLQKQSDEYLNNWKRAAADMANYKKDEMTRAGMLIGYAKEGIFLNVLPVLDSIYLLKQHTNKLEFVSLSEGIMQIEKQIQEFLKKEGIEEIAVMGQKFDPNSMEIV